MTDAPQTPPTGPLPGHIDAEDLSAYLDGELTHDERVAVETHLAMCHTCRDELAALRWTVDFTRAMPRAAIPAGASFHIPVPDDIEEPGGGFSWTSGLAWASMAVAAASVTIAVLSARQQTGNYADRAAEVAARPPAAAPAAATEGLTSELGSPMDSAAPGGLTVATAESRERASADEDVSPGRLDAAIATEVALGPEVGGESAVADSPGAFATQVTVRMRAEATATASAMTGSPSLAAAASSSGDTAPTRAPPVVANPSGPRAASLAPHSDGVPGWVQWAVIALGAMALAAVAFALGRRSTG